jgi:beta-lactamase superfamily II metal-dependent hydrolase
MRLLAFASLVVTPPLVWAQTAGKDFTMYFADVEDGQSVLYISSSGKTLMMDGGYPGTRDADRVVEVLKDAGVGEIDYLVSTHYDLDHIGGLKDLSDPISIHNFVDHGVTVAPEEQFPGFLAAYAAIYGRASHRIVKAGAPS